MKKVALVKHRNGQLEQFILLLQKNNTNKHVNSLATQLSLSLNLPRSVLCLKYFMSRTLMLILLVKCVSDIVLSE